MTTSRTIAGLAGPTLLAIGVAIFINLSTPSAWPVILGHLADPAIIFIVGVLAFLGGLAIVRVHNQWTGGWPILVTIVGWLAIIGGLARMFFPTQLSAWVGTLVQTNTPEIVAGALLVVIGGILTVNGIRQTP